MIVSTTNDVAGYKVVRHLGLVRGITVRSRSVFGTIGGSLQTLVGGNMWTLKAPLRAMLRFRTHNLLDPFREPPFDLIVLKNVLIYFDAASKQRVLTNIRQLLVKDGYLLTGAAEGVGDLLAGMQSKQGWLHRAANSNHK